MAGGGWSSSINSVATFMKMVFLEKESSKTVRYPLDPWTLKLWTHTFNTTNVYRHSSNLYEILGLPVDMYIEFSLNYSSSYVP